MLTQTSLGAELPAVTQVELGSYRYRVFVERLGWDLPGAAGGIDQDQFDRADTVHAMVRDAEGRLCGCARLLPTTGPYLLSEVFPHLLDGASPPCDSAVWELSRYTTEMVEEGSDNPELASQRFRLLLRAAVEVALTRGARRFITFSYLGVERIARRFGLHVHRAGAVHLVDGRPVLAFWIELDQQTLAALDLAPPAN
ncbi:MAG TPA: acyl-homoserine-lactone synthase [Rhodanobacteraceae bacterium]|nr:acyl-homoserine-lactone synthase [Rhodanobacteraceae bacterium]